MIQSGQTGGHHSITDTPTYKTLTVSPGAKKWRLDSFDQTQTENTQTRYNIQSPSANEFDMVNQSNFSWQLAVPRLSMTVYDILKQLSEQGATGVETAGMVGHHVILVNTSSSV